MMTASDQDKEFWSQYLKKVSNLECDQLYFKWIEYGQCIEFVTPGYSLLVLSRLSHDSRIPPMIVDNPWLHTDQERQVYQNANATFWQLIFMRMQSVEDVRSFSQVSRVHHQVARRNIAYEIWIEKLFKRECYYSNPFKDQPLWIQFLKLSGVPTKSWNEWINTNVECFFFALVSLGGWGMFRANKSTKFDVETWTVVYSFQSNVRKDENSPNQALLTDGNTFDTRILADLDYYFRWNMDCAMCLTENPPPSP